MDGIRVIQLGNGEVEMQGAAPSPHDLETQPPVLKSGQFGKGVRVADVRMKTGAIHTFGGDLLEQALKNGAKIIRVLQENDPNRALS